MQVGVCVCERERERERERVQIPVSKCVHACGFACVCIHVFGCLFAEWVLPPAKKSINVLSKIITSIPAKVGFEQIKQNLFCFLQLFSC